MLDNEDIECLIATLVSLLEDSDSFVYLSVIHTIRTLLQLRSKTLLTLLMSLFASNETWAKYDMIGLNYQTSNLTRRRVLLAESLMFGIRRLGDLVPFYADEILAGCLRVIRAENRLFLPVKTHVSNWDMNKMILKEDCVAPSNSSSVCANPNAKVADDALQVDSILLRQSAISLIAEVVARSGYGSSRYIEDIIQLAADVLTVEHSSHNMAIAMRR